LKADFGEQERMMKKVKRHSGLRVEQKYGENKVSKKKIARFFPSKSASPGNCFLTALSGQNKKQWIEK